MINEKELKANGYKVFNVQNMKTYVKLFNGYNVYFGIFNSQAITSVMVYELKNQSNFTLDLDEYFTLRETETIFESHYNKNIKNKSFANIF